MKNLFFITFNSGYNLAFQAKVKIKARKFKTFDLVFDCKEKERVSMKTNSQFAIITRKDKIVEIKLKKDRFKVLTLKKFLTRVNLGRTKGQNLSGKLQFL